MFYFAEWTETLCTAPNRGFIAQLNAMLCLLNRRWRREFNKAVKLPSRDTIFDYFLSITNGECRFEPWTKHKIFKVVDFDSNNMKMNEVRSTQRRTILHWRTRLTSPDVVLSIVNILMMVRYP